MKCYYKTLENRNFRVLYTKYYSDDQNKKFEVDETCTAYGGEDKCMQNIAIKRDRERPLGRLGMGGRTIHKLI
jgi:hypothetical protein